MKTTLRSREAQEIIFYVLVCMQNGGVLKWKVSLGENNILFCFVFKVPKVKKYALKDSWEHPHPNNMTIHSFVAFIPANSCHYPGMSCFMLISALMDLCGMKNRNSEDEEDDGEVII